MRITIDAAILIEQYAVDDSDTLLVLDEDTPYEEQLHLVLVRKNRILDRIVIGSIYSSGVFKEVSASSNTLQFRFESDAVWSLSIDSAGRRVFGGLPRGARRRGRLFARRHMFLDYGEGV
ncbi:MAG: hypothetical protein AAGE86_04350 [Pseudomonadota bacterium]